VVNEPVLDRRLPSPTQLAGTDLLPQIEHIVVLMKENHTFDNYFGMLGRGDGFTLDVHGQPVNSNPDAAGRPVTVHHLTSPWQPWHGLDQHWNASHLQWNHGANDGFVRTTNSSLPMGYWTAGGPALLLRAGTDVPDRGPLLRVVPGPDVPEPAFPAGRHRQRPGCDQVAEPVRTESADRHHVG